MAEQANPEAGASQAAPTIEQRMQNFLTQHDQEQSAPPPDAETPTAAEQPEGQAPELTVADLPEDGTEGEAQPTVDEFEIVHNGTQKRLSREETIRLAQQGFDYTAKTQAVAEQAKAVQAQLQRVQQLEQLTQALAPDLAQVKAVEAQLRQYQNVDWVQLATDNPLEYPRYHAQYDQLVNAFQGTVNQFQQKASAVQQQKAQITAQIVSQQREKLLDKLPSWRDGAKYQQGAQEVREYLTKEGLDPNTIEGLTDAVSVTVAWKAAQYDKLLRAKTDKVKQLKPLPPVTRPGASQPSGSTDQRDKLKARLARTGDTKDAAALLLDRWK
jgi:hypothetical protein